MKSIIKSLCLLLFLSTSSIIQPQRASAQVGVSFQFFYDQLSPYGSWVNYPEYGYAWIPNVSEGFSPYYTGGHWVFTQFGWMWVSDYSWGWAAFHYGNWYYDPFYGWMWIPGTEWAPAWVVWSSAPGYYGWAPLAPRVSINVVISGGYRVPADQWVFVPSRYIASTDISHYYGPRTSNKVIIEKSTIINNTYVDNSTHVTYVKGPDRNEVQKAVGRNIEPVAVKNMDRPGQSVSKNEVNIYQPRVEKEVAGKQSPAPKKVVDLKDVKSQREGSGNVQQKETAPKQVTPSKQQVQPKQPAERQNETPKKKPVEEQPDPKTMRQPAQKQYDYALRQDNPPAHDQQSSVIKQQGQMQKVDARKTEAKKASSAVSKNNSPSVKQMPNSSTKVTEQRNIAAKKNQVQSANSNATRMNEQSANKISDSEKNKKKPKE